MGGEGGDGGFPGVAGTQKSTVDPRGGEELIKPPPTPPSVIGSSPRVREHGPSLML